MAGGRTDSGSPGMGRTSKLNGTLGRSGNRPRHPFLPSAQSGWKEPKRGQESRPQCCLIWQSVA
eukprot:63101-Amphidinium_carterae.1